MRIIFLAVGLFAVSSPLRASSSGGCTAIYDTLDANQKSVEERSPLKTALESADSIRYETDLEGKGFSVVLDKKTGDALVQITTAPDYTVGSVINAHPDERGRLSLAEVNGYTVHKIICFFPGRNEAELRAAAARIQSFSGELPR